MRVREPLNPTTKILPISIGNPNERIEFNIVKNKILARLFGPKSKLISIAPKDPYC